MGFRRRVRQTGKAMPSLAAHARHNSSHDGFTWAQFKAEREAEALRRGVRFERNVEVDDDELDEAA